MKAQKRLLPLLAILLVSFFVTGCSFFPGNGQRQTLREEESAGQGEEDLEMIRQNMEGFVGEEAYKKNFVKPQMDSHIYIDVQGYGSQDGKQAFFCGENLQGEFSVYERDSGKLVFAGRIMQTEDDPLLAHSVYRGDFSSVTEPGTYYIQMPVIGRSYDFEITEDYDERVIGQLRQLFLEKEPAVYFENAGKEPTEDSLYGFLQMSIAYQLVPDAFDEKLLQRLCEDASYLAVWKDEADKRKDSLSAAENYLISTCLAYFASVIQEKDAALGRQCLQTSRKAYQQAAPAAQDIGDESYSYMAAASLYRATGNATYHNQVKKVYRDIPQTTDQEKKSDIAAVDTFAAEADLSYRLFLASFFYLTTERTVDYAICEEIMTDFVAECAGYLDEASVGAYGLATGSAWTQAVTGKELTDAQKEEWERMRRQMIRQHAIRLAIADYTVVGQEYVTVCRQQMHYLMHDTYLTEMQEEGRSAMWLILNIITGSEETK